MTALEMVDRHGPALRKIARKMAGRTVGYADTEDLTQDAYLALLQMNQRPDASELECHAHVAQRVTGAILDSLRARDACERSTRAKARAIGRAEQRLSHELGRKPRDVEIAIAANVDLDEYFEIKRAVHVATPRADEVTDYEAIDEVYLTEHAGKEFDNPLEILVSAEVVECIAEAIRRLRPRHREVLMSHDAVGRTFKSIALDLGVTESRVCQMHKEAIANLRKALRWRGFI